jgi:hypothetical protein
MHDRDPAEALTSTGRRPTANLLSWLPLLWSQVLFSGERRAAEPARPQALVLLAILPGVLLYGCLGFHLFEPDEGRYAEIPREMLARGEWVVPYLQGEPYLDKPPLLYWLVGLSYRLFGIHAWSARLVPALAVHACILASYLFGRRWLGERPAFWGSLALSLAPGFASMGRLLILDGLLTLWITLSLAAGFEAIRGDRLRWGWWLAAAVACGLGILTKGPVAVLLLVPPLWVYRRLTGEKGDCPPEERGQSPFSPTWRIGARALLGFAAVLLAVALPWYVAICLRLPGFAKYFLWEHNVVRFVAPFDHLRPFWYYGPVLLLGLLPGTLLAAPLLRFLFAADEMVARRRCPELGFVLLAGGWCILFFSISGCKLPTYILPAFPPLALGLGYYLVAGGWLATAWPRIVGITSFLLLFLVHNVALPWYAGYRGPLAQMGELRRECEDRGTPLVCYPRSCDSVGFYAGREDLRTFRSKQTHLLVYDLQQRPRTVLLLTHRHSLQALRHALPPELQVTGEKHLGLGELPGVPSGLSQSLTWFLGETALGLCDVVVIERRPLPELARRNP